MFRFENPQYLYFLGAILVLAALHYYATYRKKKKLSTYGDPELMKFLMIDVSPFRREIKFWLAQLALASFIVAWARPQYGTKIENRERSGIEALIAIDVSNSMLAEDVAPNRLDRAKQILSKMIDNMVDMSEFSQGVIAFETSDLALVPVLDSIYEHLKTVADEKEIVLEYTYDLQGLDHVCEDEYRLRQVFMNLLSNAITFSERGKKVFCKIRMEEYQGDKALMKAVISDEGIGMEETFMRHAYRPFEKEGRKNDVDGVGLGLPVVSNIIEQKEGRIWIESEPYQGTKVSFLMPMQLSEACMKRKKHASAVLKKAMGRADFTKLRALVVADDEVIRQTAGIRLQKIGVTVEHAVNRQQAVNMVAESKEGYYDIVFIQMGMPLKGAILALREIHLLDRMDVHEMPIVAMNINPFLEDIQNAGSAEIDYQWLKPYKTEELKKILYREFYPEKYKEIYEKRGFRVIK
mgnify:CR=1 FL=1